MSARIPTILRHLADALEAPEAAHDGNRLVGVTLRVHDCPSGAEHTHVTVTGILEGMKGGDGVPYVTFEVAHEELDGLDHDDAVRAVADEVWTPYLHMLQVDADAVPEVPDTPHPATDPLGLGRHLGRWGGGL